MNRLGQLEFFSYSKSE